MAHLDEYMKDAEQHNLGNDAAEKAKSTAKKTAKKPINKAVKKVKNKIMEKTGLKAAKGAAKQGAKAALKAAAGAAKGAIGSAVSFLVSNPVGWVIGGVLIVLTVTVVISVSTADQKQETEAVSNTLLTENGELTEEGVNVVMGDCPDERETQTGDVDTDATMTLYAQQVYSVFSSYGLSDECIAGILGNLQVESGVDPTTIEGIYDEPYRIGPRKLLAIGDLDTYVRTTLSDLYSATGTDYTQNSGYMGDDGKKYPGLGLIQWTGPGAQKLLAVGSSTGYDWWTMNYQLAYMVGDTHYRPGFFAEWKQNMSASPEEAASYFAEHYEGNTTLAQEQRRTNARNWYNQMANWDVDEAYYDSVLALSTNMGGAAADDATGEAAQRCDTPSDYDNTSAAAAAVSYAYPTKAQGEGNNGTALYQQVHDYIWPSDNIYMSCDRSVATAIVWSGTDISYPNGNTNAQYDYLLASPKWESLGMAGSLTIDDLLPGDVFILDGHTFMYVGTELVQQIHGDAADAGSDSVSGSYGDRSPGCGADATQILNRGGVDWDTSRGQYEVFRCINPDDSTQYENAGSASGLE